jgi:hypothetical protein
MTASWGLKTITGAQCGLEKLQTNLIPVGIQTPQSADLESDAVPIDYYFSFVLFTGQ